MTKLIALCSAVPRSGKTTVSDILCDLWDDHYECYYKSTDLFFAETLKEMLEPLLRHVPEYYHYVYKEKNEVIPGIGKSYRYLCRSLGDGWGRKMVGESLWIDTWKRQYDYIAPRMNLITCSDLRYRNEFDIVRECGGEVWYIHRSQALKAATEEDYSHASENNIKPDECNRIIYNDYDSVDKLKDMIKSLNLIQD